MPYHALPANLDRQDIFTAIRDIIKTLHSEDGYTYLQISKAIESSIAKELKISSIKSFLNKDNGRINSNNATLLVLYNYVRSRYTTFPTASKAKTLHCWSRIVDDKQVNAGLVIEREMERSLILMFKKWLRISDAEVEKLSSKLFDDFSGDYVLLRKSVRDENLVVKSVLKIEKNPHGGLPKLQHHHHDRHNIPRVSTGILFPMSVNIYAILEVEHGEGLEFIALRNPVQHKFSKMMGFLISMNMDRNILSARIFIEKQNEFWLKSIVKPRFAISDCIDNKRLMQRLKLLDAPRDSEKYGMGTATTIPNIQLDEADL